MKLHRFSEGWEPTLDALRCVFRRLTDEAQSMKEHNQKQLALKRKRRRKRK